MLLERYETKEGTVYFDIAVKNVQQLFDMRDPAPFRERDLDDDLVEFILSRIEEVPHKTKVALRFLINEESLDQKHQDAVSEAVSSHFKYEAERLTSELNKRFRQGRFFLLLGICTLFACLATAELINANTTESMLSRLATEGIVISGWVAMWRPIEVFLYDWWPIRDQIRLFLRLADAPIEVKCSNVV